MKVRVRKTERMENRPETAEELVFDRFEAVLVAWSWDAHAGKVGTSTWCPWTAQFAVCITTSKKILYRI